MYDASQSSRSSVALSSKTDIVETGSHFWVEIFADPSNLLLNSDMAAHLSRREVRPYHHTHALRWSDEY